MGSKNESYYTSLGKEDYYLEGGEPPGKWVGKGAEALAITGIVKEENFLYLFRGYSPDGSTRLVQNAGVKNRRPGYDLTFSAPKSVSTLWSQADSQTRQIIQQAQQKAVETALEYLEGQVVSRMGKGGHQHVAAKLAIASFEHGTSRAQDPQLHTHALVLNVAVRPDGSTGTIEASGLYHNKMLGGAIYRAELAKELQQTLGLRAEKVERWFEIKGVNKRLIEEFSKRRHAIEDYLEKHNLHSAKAAEVAALKTRDVKGHVARSELFEEWQKVGGEFGYQAPSPDYFTAAEDAPLKAAQASLREIMEKNAHFTKRELLTGAAIEATPDALSWVQIQEGVEECLNQPEVIQLGEDERGEIRFTTQEMLDIEKRLLEHAASTKERISHRCKKGVLKNALATRTLTEEQRKALAHLIDSHGAIKMVSGLAGTGKTYMLDAAREVWEASGYRVLGAAFTGKAAKGLTAGAHINSRTLHSLLWSVEQGYIALNKNTVLVVDEAGMVPTRQLARLIQHAANSGCKLILVGDHRQLQPIGPGGAKQKLMQLLGCAELHNITRQQEAWAREAVKHMADGKAEEALHAYLKQGLVHIADAPGMAKDKLIDDWCKGGLRNPHHHLILAAYRDDVFYLNRLAQMRRKEAGLLGKERVRVGGQTLYQGDVVLCTRNCRRTEVENGEFAKIKAINHKKMTVTFEDGRQKTIDTRTYDRIQLGYASTTHKAQGETRYNAYVLMGGDMQDRELSYVQLSRAKCKTRIYVEPLEEEKQTRKRLVADMQRSRQKQMAVSYESEKKREYGLEM